MTRSGSSRWWRREQGQTLVEAAFAFMLLLTLVLGMIDFAFIFNVYLAVVNAANEGATYGASSIAAAVSPTGIRNAALAESGSWHCSSTTVSSATSYDPFGRLMVEVTVRCRVADLIAVANVLPDLEVSNTAVKRVTP